jgi:hypothetical protein
MKPINSKSITFSFMTEASFIPEQVSRPLKDVRADKSSA